MRLGMTSNLNPSLSRSSFLLGDDEARIILGGILGNQAPESDLILLNPLNYIILKGNAIFIMNKPSRAGLVIYQIGWYIKNQVASQSLQWS